MKEKPLQVIVCGSTFGQFYLEAIKCLPHRFELTGLLANGSERSQKTAEHYAIPLYTDIADLPGSIDLACVVLRSGVLGGKGTEVSLELLQRGIHVIQEQPIHNRDLASCLRIARQNKLQFQLGDLYVHLPAVRRFIAAARRLLQHQDGIYLDLACATQVSFPLMHILQEALPSIRPWKINQVIKDEGPFQLLTGTLGRIPVILRAHNEVDPQNPDNHLHLLHRITLGVEGGSLSLTDTHGPVVWRPRLHFPENLSTINDLGKADPAHLRENSTEHLGPAPSASYKEILTRQWPQAIAQDLLQCRDKMSDPSGSDSLSQKALLYAHQWQELTAALGYPVLRSRRSHMPLTVELLRQAVASMDREETMEPLPGAAGNTDVFTCTECAEETLQGITPEQINDYLQRLEKAILCSMLFTLQASGTLTDKNRDYAKDEILDRARTAPRHRALISRWLRILAERGHIGQKGDRFTGADPVGRETVQQDWERVTNAWVEKLGERISLDYLISNAEQLPQLIRDEQQATLLLFPEGRTDIAIALYRDTLTARYLNKSVAEAVVRIAAGLVTPQGSASLSPGKLNKPPLRILEIGAGTGATTEVVAARLKAGFEERCELDYLFSDLSNFFLASAHRHYANCPWMRFDIVDMDKPFTAQGLKAQSMDVIIAAGVLNNARNTVEAIENCLQVLTPGGWLLITEPTREFLEILISQAFMMTPPEDDRSETHTSFLSIPQWREVFHRAGVKDLAVLPDKGHLLEPLGQTLFIARKSEDLLPACTTPASHPIQEVNCN
jgi:thiazolinyl imide reductase